MKTQPMPVDIVVDLKKRQVKIIWQDGHESSYTLDKLRQSCPCAMCHDVRQKAQADPLFVFNANMSQTSSDLEPQNPVQLVGQYALQFSWVDGHNTGIYTYPFLRELSQQE